MFAFLGRDRSALVSIGLVLVGLLGYVAAVYLVVVVAGGAVAPPQMPRVVLTFIAAALVALTLEPLRVRLRQWLPTSADERLSRLTVRYAAREEVGDYLERMARLVTEALAAQSSDVTVSIGNGALASGRWPRDAPEATTEPNGVLIRRPVLRGSRQLGDLTVRLSSDRSLSPIQQRLLDDAARRAALVVDTTRLDRALRSAVDEAAARARELRQSRSRIVAAIEDERRRIERDIHDGAQQHLVALAVNLRLLRVVLERDPVRGAALAEEVRKATQTAIETLERLSHGMYPPLLVELGPVAALRTAPPTNDQVLEITDGTRGQRWPADIERAIYFGCAEALQNAAKHGSAQRIVIVIEATESEATFVVTDDGLGFDPALTPPGSGTVNMRDRVESVGGTLMVTSAPGLGTTVCGRIPLVDRPDMSSWAP